MKAIKQSIEGYKEFALFPYDAEVNSEGMVKEYLSIATVPHRHFKIGFEVSCDKEVPFHLGLTIPFYGTIFFSVLGWRFIIQESGDE